MSVHALDELKAYPQWVGWRLETRDGRSTKVPYVADAGARADSTDRATWMDFSKAAAAYKHAGHTGLGFVVSEGDPYVGIDLDRCRDSQTGSVADWAQKLVDRFRSYAEVTPSGSGIRIWIKAKLPPGGNRKGNVEIYDRARFFTVTGQPLDGSPDVIEPRQAELEELHAEFWPPTSRSAPPPQPVGPNDQQLLDKALGVGFFERLWRGDLSEYDDDDSRGDLALCRSLAFWTAKDAIRIDRIFRASGLMRPKWDERRGASTYGQQTIERAIARTAEVFNPDRPVRRAASHPSHLATALADRAANEESSRGVTLAGGVRLYDLGQQGDGAVLGNIDWQIEDWLVRNQVHLFVGAEKRGKSTQQWRRIAAISDGADYHGSRAQQGRVLVVTEMSDGTIRTLLDDDDIEPAWDNVRVVYLNELAREERLAAISKAVESWDPIYICLDPMDECLGQNEDEIRNSASTSDAFDVLGLWARSGRTVEGLYHFNNAGKIANSYKYRSKPDHIFEIVGTGPGDVTIKYTGRSRAIPPKRRLTGNGDDGYKVSILEAGQVGRPSVSLDKVRECLAGSLVPLSVTEIAKQTGLPYSAVKQAVWRGAKKGQFEPVGDGYQLPVTKPSDESLYHVLLRSTYRGLMGTKPQTLVETNSTTQAASMVTKFKKGFRYLSLPSGGTVGNEIQTGVSLPDETADLGALLDEALDQ